MSIQHMRGNNSWSCLPQPNTTNAHDATPVQITPTWPNQRDEVVVIQRASGGHNDENIAASDLELFDEEVTRIDVIDREKRLVGLYRAM